MNYIDREGNCYTKNSKQDQLLERMYHCVGGRMLLKLLVQPWISSLAGKFCDSRHSIGLIEPFVKKNQIDMTQYEETKYHSYNEFFTRKIKSNLRPISKMAEDFISPCDGKLSVYPILKDEEGKNYFQIKHTCYTLSSLLRSKKLAKKYEGGYACIFRLTVDDYHRFFYVDDGEKSCNYRIPGVLHTVNPVANDVEPIYIENTREFSLLKSENFKTILMMEVGALLVGKIVNYHEKAKVHRGQEKGRFEFGGSTVILLLQKDAVDFEKALIRNTQKGYETIVKMRETLGKAKVQ